MKLSNFILTVNIVLPIFLLMATGYACRHLGVMNDEHVSAMNRLVFRVFLPVNLCNSLMKVTENISNPSVLAFGFIGTLITCIVAFLIIPKIEKQNARRGVMIQGIFRTNYAIFGIPLSEALFPQGDGGVAALMVIATIPLFNVLAVITLETFRGGKPNFAKIMKGIAKNPLIWGCLIGFALMQIQCPLPEFMTSTIGKLASIASPLALFALGGSINLKTFGANFKSLALSLSARLVIVPAIALSIAYLCGFRGVEFATLMIVFGAPSAVGSYTMAGQMDGDAELAAQQVMLSTVFSAVTMFLMIFMFKTLGIF